MIAGQTTKAEVTLEPEAILVDYTERLARHTKGRAAVQIHLSKLQAVHRREHYVRIAANAFESLVKPFDGQIFVLRNCDIVFLCKGASYAQIDSAVVKLRLLFSDDPLIEREDGERLKFCTWYDMACDYPLFLSTVRRLADEARRQRDEEAARRQFQAKIGAPDAQPITPAQLGKIEAALAQADLSSVLRRQSVCALARGEVPQPLFKEIYVSIGELQQAVVPTIAMAGNRWLFQYLTGVLDRRVLALLQRCDDSDMINNFSINLNIATLLSPEFLAFDNALPIDARNSAVIELQPIDIFADMGGFMFVRDYLRERGYRVCVDGLNEITFEFIDRERLGVDFVKLLWNREIADGITPRRIERLRTMVKTNGLARVILGHCDSQDALEFGLEIGATLFQGRTVDKLLQAKARVGSEPPPPLPTSRRWLKA